MTDGHRAKGGTRTDGREALRCSSYIDDDDNDRPALGLSPPLLLGPAAVRALGGLKLQL